MLLKIKYASGIIIFISYLNLFEFSFYFNVQEAPFFRWVLRHSLPKNSTDDEQWKIGLDFENYFGPLAKKMDWQIEETPGNPHIQGIINLKDRVRKTALVKMINQSAFRGTYAARMFTTYAKAKEYVTKTASRKFGPFSLDVTSILRLFPYLFIYNYLVFFKSRISLAKKPEGTECLVGWQPHHYDWLKTTTYDGRSLEWCWDNGGTGKMIEFSILFSIENTSCIFHQFLYSR